MGIAIASCTQNAVSAAPSTGVTITKPASLADGDVLYAFISKTTYANTATFTCAGWTEVTSGTRGTTTGNDRHLVILRKVITNAAGEPASYTFVTTSGTTSSICGVIARVTGADTTTPEDLAVPSITMVSNDATPASRALTTVSHGCLVLSVCQLSLTTTALKTWGAPSGYSTITDGAAGIVANSLNNQTGIAHKIQAVAGAVGTNAWTHSANDSTTEAAVTVVAVRPAPIQGSWWGIKNALGEPPPPEFPWLNHVTIALPRNGTTDHAIDPSSGSVVAGSLFTPTAGRELVCVVHGGVTSTTPTDWTLETNCNAIANSGLYVWHRTAAGSDTWSTTHNGSNYPLAVDIYEFAAGTTFQNAERRAGGNYNNLGSDPDVSLTGTNFVLAVVGQGVGSGETATGISFASGAEIVDTVVAYSGTDGYNYAAAYLDGVTDASINILSTCSITTNTCERIIVAFHLA